MGMTLANLNRTIGIPVEEVGKKMANKKSDFKLDDMKEINKQVNVKNCWFDDKEGLFHCLMLDGTEWTSPTGSAQDEWKRIPKRGKPKSKHDDSLLPQLETQLYALHSGFTKGDSGKLKWSLLPFEELKDVVKVLMHGAEKYSADNWKKCDDVTRYKDALMRHVVAYVSGDKTDPEFGLPHLAHAICNCLFLMWFDSHKEDRDETA